MNRTAALKEKFSQIITPRKLRFFRESLTGYLFVTPALILIFTFGIFPVAFALFVSPALILIFMFGIFPVIFALFVSLHKWRIVRTDFVGLGNFVRAVGNLAYVAAFFLGIVAIVGSVLIVRKIIQQSRDNNLRPWLLSLCL